MEESRIVGGMARETPHIYELLEDQLETYQDIVVKVEGNIVMQSMFVLIYLGPTHSYVTLRITEGCSLERKKHVKS